jgi:hypothetical protein
MNYIKIMNWFWQEVPYYDGCNAGHISLFLALFDSINRNRWQPIGIEYEILVYKCKLSKKTYLAARTWLREHNLIDVIEGKNGIKKAIFSLGSAVENCTGASTSAAPLQAPLPAPINNKHINDKHVNLKPSKKNFNKKNYNGTKSKEPAEEFGQF